MKIRSLALAPLLLSAALLTACADDPKSGVQSSGTGSNLPPSQQVPGGGMTTSGVSGAGNRTVGIGGDEEFRVNVGDRVFFDLDRYDLNTNARATLDKQAAWLAQNGGRRIVIEGYADERGTREYNLALGERRAESVKTYLASKGIGADRVRVLSYGKERPVVVGHDEQSWSQNRRAVTVLN